MARSMTSWTKVIVDVNVAVVVTANKEINSKFAPSCGITRAVFDCAAIPNWVCIGYINVCYLIQYCSALQKRNVQISSKCL